MLLVFNHEAERPVNFEHSGKISFLIMTYLFAMKIFNPLFYYILRSFISIVNFFAGLVAKYLVPVNSGVSDWKLPGQSLEWISHIV